MPMLKKWFKCWFSHPMRKAAFSVNLKRLLVSSADQCHSRHTLLSALEPTASHSDLQGQRLWIRTRIFTIQTSETSACDTLRLRQVVHSLIVFIPKDLNKGESLPKTHSPLFQGWDLPAHQFSSAFESPLAFSVIVNMAEWLGGEWH